MKIEAVLFDLYGTLVDITVDEASGQLWRAIADYLEPLGGTRNPEELKHDYLAAIILAKRQGSRDVFERAVAIMLEGIDYDQGRFYALFRRSSRVTLSLRSFVVDLLMELRRREIKIALVSNTETVLTAVDFEDIDFPANLFDATLYSSEIGTEKPDRGIYIQALRQLGVTADRALYIGDNITNDILGSSALGLRSIWIANENLTFNLALPSLCIGRVDEGGKGILPLIDRADAVA